jgi:hypothetical protein
MFTILMTLFAAEPTEDLAFCTEVPKDAVEGAWQWFDDACAGSAHDELLSERLGCYAEVDLDWIQALRGEPVGIDLDVLSCGEELELYTNKAASTQTVTVVAGDYCPGRPSFLTARRSTGIAVPGETALVAEGQDRTYQLSVPAGGSVDMDCNAGCVEDSTCTYRVVGAI